MIRRIQAVQYGVVAIGLFVGSGCASVEGANEQQRTDATESLYVWTQDSFDDFRQGTLSDGGNNTYVTASGKIQLVNRWDLNNDGHIDLVFANSHPQAEKLDAVIYWGNGKDFDASRTMAVPNAGAQWTIAADLNRDGKTDAVIPNYANGTWSKMDSFVYFGDPEGVKNPDQDSARWTNYPFGSKQTLPTEAAQSAAVGDLDSDGYPDIVFALSAGFWEYRGGSTLASPSRIFWGGAEGYARDRYTDIEAAGASDVAIADLNHDGALDVVLANREKEGNPQTDSFVYFGSNSRDGFSPGQRRAGLATRQANAVTIADVNGDGWPDVLFANGLGNASFIYLSDKGSFAIERRIELPTSDARDVAAADLNGDQRADVFFTNHQTAGNPLTKSYLYWNGDRGLSVDNRQEFETVGAWGVSIGDLNGDQRPEIVVSNFKEHQSFEVPSYIFWNSADDGFNNALRTSLFTQGAVGNTIADFNGDGHADVLFNNTSNRWRGGVAPAFVYWGNAKGKYSVERRTDLPSVEPYDWASGDLNDDGWPDLILANMSEVGRRITENFIYWGSPRGYEVENRSALVGKGTRGVAVADLDENGWLDVLVFNTTSGPDDKNPSIYIYWGEPNGYSTPRRTELPGGGTGLPLAADLNGDGNLDIIAPGGGEGAWIYWGDGTRNYSPDRRYDVPDCKGVSSSEVADMNRDGYLDLLLMRRGVNLTSYVYYGNAMGEFSADRRDEFKPNETQGVTVADVNKDGWLDVVAGCYKDGGSRATMTPVYWGSPHGLSEDNVLKLPTNAGTGSQVADYDGDGYNDLLLYNHRSEGDPNKRGSFGDHTTHSYLYWGGPKGFSFERKQLILGQGVHHDGGADLGNISDRQFEFAYISPPHEYGRDREGVRIDWSAMTPHDSIVKLQVRTAADEQSLHQAAWTGPAGAGSSFKEPGSQLDTPPAHSWIQYRAVLASPKGKGSPALDAVRFSFRGSKPPALSIKRMKSVRDDGEIQLRPK
ncbi:MAG TPA: VCBS repeat-containing protein [Tepidisphaeraceae bacterium]|nr:VCBS repeat-containing protein [Tepidisphaeraceae bacterium]